MSNFCTFKIGEEVSNSQIINVFKCGNMGGMRRSRVTNSLMIISDHTKGLYEDKWDRYILHYTGMGKSGDQKINFAQNKTLTQSNENGIEVHLFEVFEATKYIYRGEVKLVAGPYQDRQKGEDGVERSVWMFPLKLLERNQTIPLDIIKRNQEVKEKKARRLSESDLRDRIKAKIGGESSVRNISSIVYDRDADIAEYAKRRAKGICQLCEQNAPFKKQNGEPYLECHHIIPLSEGGSDTVNNTVALCANCHRKMHSLNLNKDRLFLKRKVQEL